MKILFLDFGVDVYADNTYYRAYDLWQAQGPGSSRRFAVSEKGYGVIETFDTSEAAVKRLKELSIIKLAELESKSINQ